MARKDERMKYAVSFKGKGIIIESLARTDLATIYVVRLVISEHSTPRVIAVCNNVYELSEFLRTRDESVRSIEAATD